MIKFWLDVLLGCKWEWVNATVSEEAIHMFYRCSRCFDKRVVVEPRNDV